MGAIPVVANGDAREIECLGPPKGGDVDVACDHGNPLEFSGSGAITDPGYLEGSHPPGDVRNNTGMAGCTDNQ
jgi:hypothetical protein